MMQKLKFDQDNAVHVLETLPTNVDVGKYVFSFEVATFLFSISFNLIYLIYVIIFLVRTCRLYLMTQTKRKTMQLEGGLKYLFM